MEQDNIALPMNTTPDTPFIEMLQQELRNIEEGLKEIPVSERSLRIKLHQSRFTYQYIISLYKFKEARSKVLP